MNKSWIVLFVLVLLGLVGCQSETKTPTPAATIIGPPVQAEAVSLLTLLRNPAAFRDRFIQVAGQYKSIPIPVCNIDARLSPATWSLTGPDMEVPAAGSDAALRELANDGLSLLVEGRWRLWDGPVGCGRRVPIQQVWYLEVSRIISPNPLLSASQEEHDVIVSPEETAPIVATEVAEIVTQSPASPPTNTPISSQTPTPSPTALSVTTPTATPSSLTPTFTAVPIASSTPGDSTSRTPTPSVTATDSTGEPTSTATLDPAITPTGTNTPTATSESSQAESIDYEDVEKRKIEANTANLWRFDGELGDVVTISVAPTTALDVELELSDPSGTTLSTKNDGVSGQVESVSAFSLETDGKYQIHVRAIGGTSGDYALLLQNSDSLPLIVFKGTMAIGATESSALQADTDDMWHFEGDVGEVITIRVTPLDNGDSLFYVLGPNSLELEFVDENADGEAEELTSYSLPSSGFYSIGVGEFNFNQSNYSIRLTQN